MDHIIPFALWHKNDLWNLVPALSAANSKKSDKLPTRGLLTKRQDHLVYCWETLRKTHKARFDHETSHIMSKELISGWQPMAMAVLECEAIEVTAVRRGVHRWDAQLTDQRLPTHDSPGFSSLPVKS